MKMFFYFVLDVALAGFSAKLTKGIVEVSSRILSSISKGNSVVIGMYEVIQEYSILNDIQTMSQTCMDTARDLIISTELKRTINQVTGWS